MGKRRTSNSPSPGTPEAAASTPAPAATPPMAEMDRRFARGDSGGAHKLAVEVLKNPPDPATAQHAQEILAMTKVDLVPVAIFAGMVLVLLLVFLNGIVLRNQALEKLPSPVEVEKSLVPRPAPGPDAVPQGEPRGTP